MTICKRLTPFLIVPICLATSSALAAPPPDYKGRPFTDEFHKSGPPAVPGIVQCALYDLGGEGVAYHDTTKENEGSDGLNRDPDHERAHGSHYVWHFRAKEGVDISYVKDWADLNHPNPVTPPINLFYLGWTSDGEWTNYTVDVKEPGTYSVKALYSHKASAVSFDLNGKPAATGQVPRATESWHHWDYGPIGTISFPEAGLQLLTFHYGSGNNWAFWVFEKIGPAARSHRGRLPEVEETVPDRHPHDLAELARVSPRPDIRLIATDMDGTLVDDAKQIHDELWPLIDELHARGITFCPASGRQYENLLQEFEGVADELVFIAENGSFVVARGKEISSDCLGLEVARQVVSRVRGIPEAGAVLCGKRSAYIERRDPRFVDQVTHYYTRLRLVDDLLAVGDDDVLKVAVYDFASAERSTAPRLAGLAGSHQVVVSGAHWVDVLSPTANKGQAVRQVQKALGVTPDQTMVFGDFLNDLEMMDAATYSFAMANAHPLLKERAGWLAPTNNANGVVRTIRTVLGLG